MPVNESNILDYLAKNYASSISKRALWSWCGGAEADIDYDLPPLDGWGLMWAKAGRNSAPTRIGLVREMLFDSPGEEVLLGFLEELAAEHFEVEKKVVDFFLFLLASTGGPEDRLAPLFYLLQDLPPDCILAAAAPEIQANRDDKPYTDLEKTLPQLDERRIILSPGILVDWIEFYLACLADNVPMAPVILERVKQMRDRFATLKTALVEATGPEDIAGAEEKPAAGEDMDKLKEPKAVFEAAARALKVLIEDMKALPPESGPGFFAPAVTVIAKLVELMPASGPDEAKIVLRLSAVDPIRAALWATR